MARMKKTARKQMGRRGIPRFPPEWLAAIGGNDQEAGPSNPMPSLSEETEAKKARYEESSDDEDPVEEPYDPYALSDEEETPDNEPNEQGNGNEENDPEEQPEEEPEEDPEEEDPEEEDPMEEDPMEEDPEEEENIPENEEGQEMENGQNEEEEEDPMEEVIDPILVEDAPPPPSAVMREMIVRGRQLEDRLQEREERLVVAYDRDHRQRELLRAQDRRIRYLEERLGMPTSHCRQVTRESNHGLCVKIEEAADEDGKVDLATVLRLIMEAEEECLRKMQ